MGQSNSGKVFVVLSSTDADTQDGMIPIASRKDLLSELFDCNTGPERKDEDVLYGPGFRLELTPDQDPVTQMLLTITEEEIGWQVLTKLLKQFEWKLLDPNTGRELKAPVSD